MRQEVNGEPHHVAHLYDGASHNGQLEPIGEPTETAMFLCPVTHIRQPLWSTLEEGGGIVTGEQAEKSQGIPLAMKTNKIFVVSLELGFHAIHHMVEFYLVGESILSHSPDYFC